MTSPALVLANQIALAVEKEGGRAYFVGGFVRDRLLGLDPKDVDIEVHGIEAARLEALLTRLGRVKTTGVSFGIFSMPDCGLDIALPRREEATGRGHRDFFIYTDPFIGTKRAAMRRDFTVNALMQDILSGEILDYFDGQNHLKRRVLRHVCADTFIEDPLRVLRGAQFAARFGFSLAHETLVLSSTMDIGPLARERVMGELEKAMLKAPKPSIFFELLKKENQLDLWFPEIQALTGVEQNRIFHPEGDVWEHTMQVIDRAAILRSRATDPFFFMLAALCHDLGKPATTRLIEGRIRAIGHEEAGVKAALSFLGRLSGEVRLIRYVENMVLYHMQPNIHAAQGASAKAMNHLWDRSCSPHDLYLLSKADRREQDAPQTDRFLLESLAHFTHTMSQPYVMGRDLIEAGFKPSQAFSHALALGHKLRLADIDKENALKQVIAQLKKADKQSN